MACLKKSLKETSFLKKQYLFKMSLITLVFALPFVSHEWSATAMHTCVSFHASDLLINTALVASHFQNGSCSFHLHQSVKVEKTWTIAATIF